MSLWVPRWAVQPVGRLNPAQAGRGHRRVAAPKPQEKPARARSWQLNHGCDCHAPHGVLILNGDRGREPRLWHEDTPKKRHITKRTPNMSEAAKVAKALQRHRPWRYFAARVTSPRHAILGPRLKIQARPSQKRKLGRTSPHTGRHCTTVPLGEPGDVGEAGCAWRYGHQTVGSAARPRAATTSDCVIMPTSRSPSPMIGIW